MKSKGLVNAKVHAVFASGEVCCLSQNIVMGRLQICRRMQGGDHNVSRFL